ncbi:MAG: SDR family oxidoreductase [Gammaproteobacteria bacterium]|jgi:NAD(P)-dependent dehydrogenase (short-subunit alcohol dehydrogenase family)|nr:SDR family oxidoreductase [Candidatus Thioaporhodococcus sediminis]TNF53914.1 MAG: SDR family oxidoreductase [Gammaproteobacteria bacterium]
MQHYQADSNLLTGRVILITGTADSLGAAVARACAAHGSTVILSDLAEALLAPLYDHIADSGAPEPAILPLDLDAADEMQYQAVAATLAREFGRLDGIAHCAAFAPFLSRIDDYDASEWERVLRINLSAPFLLTQACLPLLRHAPDASIIFTSDRVGRCGLAYWGAFAAAKFGIEGLMQTLADETKDQGRIRVNSLDPGIIRTGLRARLYPGENPHELPAADTMAPAYLYLLGPDSRGVTGQAFRFPVPTQLTS